MKALDMWLMKPPAHLGKLTEKNWFMLFFPSSTMVVVIGYGNGLLVNRNTANTTIRSSSVTSFHQINPREASQYSDSH